MVCRTTCMISAIFIIGSLYMAHEVKNSDVVKKYMETLPRDLKIKYEKIRDERTRIYYQGFGLGLIISLFAIIYNYKMKKDERFDIISMICFVISTSFIVNYFYYILYPKKNYMLENLQTPEQTQNWLKMYKVMQFYYHGGLLLGVIGVGVLALAFRC